MKSVLSSFFTLFCFFLVLLCPREAFEGARSGLFLWFETLLPTLFPFMVLTNLLIHTQALSYITQVLKPVLCPLFKVSETGSFAILCGFLCGYPMGAKIVASLCKEQKISLSEGQYLLSFCNNTSPAFLLNYVILSTLCIPGKNRSILLICLLSPVCISFITRLFMSETPDSCNASNSSISSLSISHLSLENSFQKLLEESLADAFTSLIQIGGYVILFSVFLNLGSRFHIDQSLPGLLILSSLEITNGIHLLTQASTAFKPFCILFLTGFGGICALFQSAAMIRNSGLSLYPYIIEKLATGLVTSLLSVLFL